MVIVRAVNKLGIDSVLEKSTCFRLRLKSCRA